jgi:hypothetical protein
MPHLKTLIPASQPTPKIIHILSREQHSSRMFLLRRRRSRIREFEFLIFASAVVEYATEERGRGLRSLLLSLLLLRGVGLWRLRLG